MKLLKRLWYKVKVLIGKIMGQFGNKRPTGNLENKPSRPHVQKAWISIIIDNQICQKEVFVIVLNGEVVFNAPIFSSEKEAEDWLDEHYPKHNYAPE